MKPVIQTSCFIVLPSANSNGQGEAGLKIISVEMSNRGDFPRSKLQHGMRVEAKAVWTQSSGRIAGAPTPSPPVPCVPTIAEAQRGLTPLPKQDQIPLFGTKAGLPDLTKTNKQISKQTEKPGCPAEFSFQINNTFFSVRMSHGMFVFPASSISTKYCAISGT